MPNKPLTKQEHQESHNTSQMIGSSIQYLLDNLVQMPEAKDGIGFVLLMFNPDHPESANYISNLKDRRDGIKAMLCKADELNNRPLSETDGLGHRIQADKEK